MKLLSILVVTAGALLSNQKERSNKKWYLQKGENNDFDGLFWEYGFLEKN